MHLSGSTNGYNDSLASLSRRNTFGGRDNQRPSIRGRRQIYLASTPIPPGDLRLRALRNQGYDSPMNTSSTADNSYSSRTYDSKPIPMDTSNPRNTQQTSQTTTMGGERYCKEHLFGNVAERLAAKQKANAENNSSLRKVSFSPDLPSRREFVDFDTDNVPKQPLKRNERSMDIFSSRKLNDSVNEEKPKLDSPRGPPLRFLRDTRVQIKRPRLEEVATPERATTEDSDEEDFWVTVFGFQPVHQEAVLELFGRHGTIVKHDNPRPGNWILIRYSTIVHVRQALERNGHMLNPNVMIGVIPTRNLSKIMSPQNQEEADDSEYNFKPLGNTSSRIVPETTPSSPRPRPSLSNGASNLPIGIRSVGYNFRPLEEETTTGSPGLMNRILSVFK